MAKILIVEDNITIQNELSDFLQKNQYETIFPEDFDNVHTIIQHEKPDLILLDINLKEWNGFDICKEIRRSSQIPIIFVTGRDNEWDELKGMRIGGDDYIKKPYNLPVLLARVERILVKNQSNNTSEIVVSGVTLNIPMGQLEYEGKILELSKNEFRILYYLFLNHGKEATKDEMIEYLWNSKLYIDENILNVNLSRLRKRLDGIGLKGFIKTVPKKGYTL